MPFVLRVHGYRFWFYMADIVEPPHVHIGKDGHEAKFWPNPLKIARGGWFRQVDFREIERIIRDNPEFLLNAWEEEKGKHVNG